MRSVLRFVLFCLTFTVVVIFVGALAAVPAALVGTGSVFLSGLSGIIVAVLVSLSYRSDESRPKNKWYATAVKLVGLFAGLLTYAWFINTLPLLLATAVGMDTSVASVVPQSKNLLGAIWNPIVQIGGPLAIFFPFTGAAAYAAILGLAVVYFQSDGATWSNGKNFVICLVIAAVSSFLHYLALGSVNMPFGTNDSFTTGGGLVFVVIVNLFLSVVVYYILLVVTDPDKVAVTT